MLNFFKRIILVLLSKLSSTDIFADKYPVSIKAIIKDEGKILFLKNESGCWDLPGGKIKKGEKLNATLVREVFEETNLNIIFRKVDDAKIVFVKDVYVLLIIAIAEIVDENALKLSYENYDYNFFKPNEIKKINLSSHLTNINFY